MTPAAAYLILAVQTKRLTAPDGNTVETRRIIRKLVIHFFGSSLPESVSAIAKANLAAVDPADPQTYALRCIAALVYVIQEEESHRSLIAQLDGLAESHARLDLAIAELGPKKGTK